MNAQDYIRLTGLAARMTTGAERGGIRMTFQGLPGPNARLTPLDERSYTPVGAVGFPILDRVESSVCV